MKPSVNGMNASSYVTRALLAASVVFAGCNAGDDGAFEADGDRFAATAVLVLGPAATSGGVLATLCAGPQGLVCAAVVVGGAVWIGSQYLYAVHAKSQADADALRALGGDATLQLAGEEVVTSNDYQAAYEDRLWKIRDTATFGSTAVEEFAEFAAVTYSWQCEAYQGGNAACVGKAAKFVNCVSHGGGDACWAPIGGIAQYVFAKKNGVGSLTYPGSCNAGELSDAAKASGCTVDPDGGHMKVYDKNGNVVTLIPHSVKDNGTCRAIIKALQAGCSK